MDKITTALVVPLKRLPRILDGFSYGIPESLVGKVRTGSVVEVDFRGKREWAVVTDIQDTKSTELEKKLKDIRSVSPLQLTDHQLHIAKLLAAKYHQSLGSIFKSFVPQQPLRKVSRRSHPHVRVIRPGRQRSGAGLAVKNTAYVLYASRADLWVYMSALRAHGNTHGQTLIVVPELLHQQEAVTWLEQDGVPASAVAAMPPHHQKQSFTDFWHACREASYIIGTTTALLMPFSNLQQVVIVEAEHPLFQRAEQNPKYHLADFLFEIIASYTTNLLLTGYSPDVTLLHASLQQGFPIMQIGKKEAAITLVDMRSEAKLSRREPIAHTVLETIIRERGKILVYVNRTGMAKVIVCADCGYTPKCNNCGKPYRLSVLGDQMVCVSCAQQTGLLTQCPQCQGTRINMRGTTTGSIVRLLQRHCPSRKIYEVAGEAPATTSMLHAADIIVASSKILSIPGMYFSIVVAVSIDQDMHLPNYHAIESTRRIIRHLASVSDTLLLQTYSPEHYVFTTLRSVRGFYEQELSWRQAFAYPPSADIASFTIKADSADELRARIQELRTFAGRLPLLGPLQNSAGSHRAVLVLKNAERYVQDIDEIVRKYYNWVYVEINPYQLA